LSSFKVELQQRTCMKLLLLIFFFLSFCLESFSQLKTKSDIYNSYDDIVGLENTGLYNGKQFKDPYLNTDGTYRYFEGYNFTKGTLEYDSQFYADIPLKYDVYGDKLITRSNDNLKIFNIELISGKVSSFSIDNHNFVKLDSLGFDIEGNNFFEVGYKGASLGIYIKHVKKKREKVVKGLLEYRFFNDNFYLLLHNKTYHNIKTVNDLRKALPKKKDVIREYYKTNKSLYKSNRDAFMLKIIQYLDKEAKV